MKLIADGMEISKIWEFFEEAANEARQSLCVKSKRGVVIVMGKRIISRGHNLTTLKKLCSPCIRESIKDNSRAELCPAIHAEQIAILNALEKGENLRGSRMYHIKIKNGIMVQSGQPSCTLCSRFLHYYGIEFALWHKKGIGLYSPEEFNEISFSYFLESKPL